MPRPIPHLVALAVLLISLSGLGSAPCEPIGKIVGGNTSSAGAWPWMAALIFADVPDSFEGQFCGGTVVHPRWVLTAAHCVQGVASDAVEVGVGSVNIDIVQRIGVVSIIIHPQFDPVSLEHDIALLLLESAVPSQVTPLALLDDPELELPGVLSTVLGWGSTNVEGTAFSHYLQEAQMPIVANSTANVASIYNGVLNGNMLVAGFQQGGVDTCFADSGGPLAVPGRGRWYMAGVTSFNAPGKGCAEPDAYGGYTRISAHRAWVESYVRPDYARWQADNAVSGPNRDDDGDGRGGFEEFAGGNDPHSAAQDREPEYTSVLVEGVRFPAVIFPRRRDSSQLSYRAEFSTDARQWHGLLPGLHQISATAVVSDPKVELVTMRAPLALSALVGARGFFRIVTSDAADVEPFVREIMTPGFSKSALWELDASDGLGGYCQDYRVVDPAVGTAFSITLRSADFDAVLQILDANTGSVLATGSSNGGGGGDELMNFTPAGGIEYLLRVKSESPAGRGAFTLSIYEPVFGLPGIGSSGASGVLSASDATDPASTEPYYIDDYLFTGAAFEQLVFVGQSSPDFDTFLQVLDLETGLVVAENDDQASGDTNSGLSFFAQPHGRYVVRASSFSPFTTGSYDLQVFPLRVVEPPETLAGSLGGSDIVVSGKYLDSFHLPPQPNGALVVITLTSNAFVPEVAVLDATSNGVLVSGAFDGVSSSTAELTTNGATSYFIDCTSAVGLVSGPYSLTISISQID